MNQAVPTFSSFPDLEPQEPNKTKGKREHRSRKEKHREQDNRVSREKHSRSRSRSQEGSSKRRKHRSKKEEKDPRASIFEDEKLHSKRRRERSTSNERDDTPYSRDYFVDKRGDVRNITYGGLHQGDVPKFHRAGRGKVLGLSSIWNIQRGSGNKQVEIGRRDRRKVARYTDSKYFKSLVEGPRRLLNIPALPAPSSGEFIALSEHKKEQDGDVLDSYRSIERRRSDESDSDASGSQTSESEWGGHSLTAEQHTIKALETTLGSSPSDVESWLKLLDMSIKSLSVLTKQATRARAEISVSLLRRAINAYPDNAASFRLRLLYIEHGGELWSEETLREEWEDVLTSLGSPQSPPWKRAIVWLNWLEWRLVANSTVAGAVNDAKRVFAMLHGDQFVRVRIRLCWRVAVFLREAGFTEQGLALLQAQVELSHFCPESLYLQPLGSKLDALEEFWEAEVPRVGEEDARGWAVWDKSGRPDAVDSGRKRPPNVMNIQDPYQRWFCFEKALDIVGVFSARSFNDDQQDPYAIIMFNDIRSFLSDIQSLEAKEYLRLAFLSFLGLNIPGIAGINILDGNHEDLTYLPDRWMLSGLGGWVATPELLFPPVENDRLITWESHTGITIGLERPQQSGFGPVKDWVYRRSLLEGVSISGDTRAWESADMQNIQIDCLGRAFNQLKEVVRLSEWDDMLMAFDAALDTKSAIKSSKQRLETDRSSLHLWRNHARLERMRGKNAEASKIYAMAIALDPQSPEMPPLVADALEFFWSRDDQNEAQQMLSRFLDIQGPFTGLNLLRARKNLDGRASLYATETLQWESCIRIKFFLELSGTTIQASIAIVDASIFALDRLLPLRESLTVWLCATISSISQIPGSMVPPAVVSERVNMALVDYGSNTLLLGLFLECERGLGIWGRVRNLLDDHSSIGSAMLTPKGLKRIAWEIWAEDWGYARWEPERVRLKFERSLMVKSVASSVVLWRMYLTFEMRVNNVVNAKAVLFRALGCCPFAKDFYMMAFGPLRTVFKINELNDLVSAMAERGLRMRRDIEEFLEGWEDPFMAVGNDEGGNEGDIELETQMYNREQAKPY